MSEPQKEILRIGDIYEWFPGMTKYQVETLIAAGTLKTLPCSAKHRRFLKSHVREVFLGNAATQPNPIK